MKDAYMNLSFYQMWYFIRTIELGSYSRASQDLNVTQSTLSNRFQHHRKGASGNGRTVYAVH